MGSELKRLCWESPFFALGMRSEVSITISVIEVKNVIFIDRNECEMLRFHIMNNEKLFENFHDT